MTTSLIVWYSNLPFSLSPASNETAMSLCQRAELRKQNVGFILWCQGVTRRLRQSIKTNYVFGISGFHFFFIWPYLCNVKSYLTFAKALAAFFVQISESNLICLSQNKTEQASIRVYEYTTKVHICSINMIELFDFPNHCRLWQISLLVSNDCTDILKWTNTPFQPLLIQINTFGKWLGLFPKSPLLNSLDKYCNSYGILTYQAKQLCNNKNCCKTIQIPLFLCFSILSYTKQQASFGAFLYDEKYRLYREISLK